MTKNYIKFKNRIIFVHIAIMLIWIGFGVRLFNIQVINRLNSPQGIKVESINGFRGNFYDVNGKNLTQNLTFYRIGVHTKKISNKESINTFPIFEKWIDIGRISDFNKANEQVQGS